MEIVRSALAWIFRRRRQPPQPPQAEPCQFQIEDGEDEWAIVSVENPRLTQTYPGIPVQPNDPFQEAAPRGLAQSLPYGSVHYQFNPANLLEELPDIPGTSEEGPQDWAREIKDRYYNDVVEKREIIHKSLQQFKEALGEHAGTDLPACFHSIKRAAGLGSHVEIVQGKLKIDDDNWLEFPEQYKRAIQHFNTMYQTCHEFLEGEEKTVQYIETRLDKLNSSRLQRRAVLDAHKKLNHIPSDIEKFAAEIRKLLHDIDLAMNAFSADSSLHMVTGVLGNLDT